MKRSVVIDQSMAWCRSHAATSRCTAGSVWRRNVGRGGKWVASATLPLVTASFSQLQPDPNAVGQHHRDRRPMAPRPQAALVLVPAQLPLSLFMARLARLAPVGHAGQLRQRRLPRQVAPEILAVLGRPPGGT